MKFDNKTWNYAGEIDDYGKACGMGTITNAADPKEIRKVTFLNDVCHGFCKF